MRSIKMPFFPLSSISNFLHSSSNSCFVQSSIGPSSLSLLLVSLDSVFSIEQPFSSLLTLFSSGANISFTWSASPALCVCEFHASLILLINASLFPLESRFNLEHSSIIFCLVQSSIDLSSCSLMTASTELLS